MQNKKYDFEFILTLVERKLDEIRAVMHEDESKKLGAILITY
jgi:hypothetical protein